MPNSKKLIYVCSPYRGDTERNVINARSFSSYVLEQGHIPIAPHLLFTQFVNDDIPEERKIGLDAGIEILRRCDELWIFGKTISDGMKREIEEASKMNIPVRKQTLRDG